LLVTVSEFSFSEVWQPPQLELKSRSACVSLTSDTKRIQPTNITPISQLSLHI
jgi:hypothetical protein